MFNLVPLAGFGLVYAVAHKATSTATSGGAVTMTFSGVQFGPEYPDRHLLCVSAFGGANAGPTGCTIGGVTATQAAADASGALTRRAQIWIAGSPTGTSGSVVLTAPSGGAAGGGVIVYSIYPMLNATVQDTLLVNGGDLTIQGGGIGFGACMDSVVTGNPLGITWSGLVEDDVVTWIDGSSSFRLSAASRSEVDGDVTVSVTTTNFGVSDIGFACASF